MSKGTENVSDKELLAILLRTGREGKSALDLAEAILDKYPIKDLLSVTIEKLTLIKGVGTDKAVTILAAFELAKRATANFNQSLPIIDSPQKGVDQLTRIRAKTKEHFTVLYLNARKQLIQQETISIGTLTASLVHPREVFASAISHHAAGIILAHNHPSGIAEPSREDILLTETMIRSGKILDIAVYDHIIVTVNDYFSFSYKGMI
jgi:DNA repair protein RadC